MSIKNWKQDDRPREKFLLKGRNAVSDSELLAILIGMGDRECSALELAQKMLTASSNSLANLAKMSIKDLTKFKGIGPAKAVTIAAALELANRAQAQGEVHHKITCSKDAYHLLNPYLTRLTHEEFYCIFLARNLRILKIEQISIGGTHATIVDPKIIAKQAIMHLASSVILAHNHPSGSLQPSQADMDITKKIKSGLELFDIQLQDHLILTDTQYYSMADQGNL